MHLRYLRSKVTGLGDGLDIRIEEERESRDDFWASDGN